MLLFELYSLDSIVSSGAKDLLKAFKLASLPDGVSQSKDCNTAYVIDYTSSIHTPTSKIVPRFFPAEFSVIITAKPQTDNDGYLLTISDLLGFVKLGIQVGRNPKFVYTDEMSSSSAHGYVRFPVNLSDGKWHQFAYSVTPYNVTLILDCDDVITRHFQPMRSFKIGSNTVTSLGKSFIESSRYSRFEVHVRSQEII